MTLTFVLPGLTSFPAEPSSLHVKSGGKRFRQTGTALAGYRRTAAHHHGAYRCAAGAQNGQHLNTLRLLRPRGLTHASGLSGVSQAEANTNVGPVIGHLLSGVVGLRRIGLSPVRRKADR